MSFLKKQFSYIWLYFSELLLSIEYKKDPDPFIFDWIRIRGYESLSNDADPASLVK